MLKCMIGKFRYRLNRVGVVCGCGYTVKNYFYEGLLPLTQFQACIVENAEDVYP